MRISILASVLVLTLLLAVPSNAEPELAEGQGLYNEYCAQCHGQDLRGGNAQSLLDGLWQFGDGRGYIVRNVKFGITHLGMPAFGESLTNDQIRTVVDYLLKTEREAGATKPALSVRLQTQEYDLEVETWIEGLEVPWAIDFVSPELALVTERPGRLRAVRNGRLDPSPVVGTPSVLSQGQGGLLDVAVDPAYAQTGWVYLAYSHALASDVEGERPPAMTRVVRGRISGNAWTDEQVVFEAPHETYRTSRHHYGSRIVFDPQGDLYFSIGDRGARDQAQDLGRPNGKVHRVRRDGGIPRDNPFVGQEGALESVFSYGHRNPQGLSVHPETGAVWASEHGPMGGDELNLLSAGLNYGWPEITYGRNYSGTTITDLVRKPGLEQPILFWRPSTAVCGMDFYRGDLFPKWRNHLLVGALKYEEVRLLRIENDRVLHQEVILKNAGRVRDVACGPDGAVYVVLNKPGSILRLTPVIR
jgi:aldose sugar dehydrogenase